MNPRSGYINNQTHTYCKIKLILAFNKVVSGFIFLLAEYMYINPGGKREQANLNENKIKVQKLAKIVHVICNRTNGKVRRGEKNKPHLLEVIFCYKTHKI